MQTKENINLKDKIFIPLTNDLLFKELLTYPSNRDILIDFLWTFTDLDKSIISKNLSVSYEEPIIKNNYYEKGYTGDIIIKFDGYMINIEMYSMFNEEAINKSIMYAMKIFSTQLTRGENYKKLEGLIQLNMLGKVKTDYIKDFSNSFKIINTKDKSELLGSDFIINFYRIDKEEEEIYNKDRKHLWGRYLNAKNNLKREEIAKGDKILMKANDWIEKYIFNDPINEKFHEWHAKIYREEYAKEKLEEKTMEMAKKLKNKNYDIKEIQELTDLSIEEIEKL